MILVSLNFLVAVDVIETLIKPASAYMLEDLYKLAIVAGVRTLLAYFLGKETEELEHEVRPPRVRPALFFSFERTSTHDRAPPLHRRARARAQLEKEKKLA